ncbi:MAG: NAD+ synthase [Desulfobacterales bacterium]|nr:NAD+ synthase [Desulfobacterales bacterium]
MKIALAQINPTIGDFEGNRQKMMGCIERARGLSCNLVVFSELVICGYPPWDLLGRQDFVAGSLNCLHRLVKSAKGIGVICGFVEKNPHHDGPLLYNSAALLEGGKILHTIRKRALCRHDFDENAYFEPGGQTAAFVYKDRKIALTICEEFFDEKNASSQGNPVGDPLARMIEHGADLIINIAASPYHIGKRQLKRDVLSHVASTYGVPLVYVNQVGGNDSIVFDGISTAFDSGGQMTARARDFEEDMVIFDADTQQGDMHPISRSDTESLLKALIAGTRDYARKCGFNKALVGISGGMDSALTACIAVRAMGKKNVVGVFMPSQYTSRNSIEDAKALAKNLQIELVEIPISPVYDQTLQALSPVLGEASSHDITEQNIQARIRAVLLMALSNRLGHMVLSSGNRSELAVGYCTLYGDMSGGLAVISDVPKTGVYELAGLINKRKKVIPNRILQKPPSAELKPDQSDRDDLPPYEILDGILKAYIEDNKGAGEIAGMGFDPQIVKETIGRVNRNQYKRRQAPPGLKVTSRSFAEGLRYPIAWKWG